MAEVVATAVVTVLIEKLLAFDLMNLARSEGVEAQLKKLEENFHLIKAVLAASAQKQNQEPVHMWLIKLQHLAYDIDDVLDDMATEVLRRKVNHQASHDSTRTSCSKLSKFVPTCCTNNFSPRRIMYGHEISPKLSEVTTRLDKLLELKNKLGLKVKVERSDKTDLNVNMKVERSDKTDVRFHQTSSVDESKVLGRKKDKEALIGRLLGNEEASKNVISVVSIVGMGGLGKTTLAQLLYNDQRVKDHFELMAWVCVSDEFIVFNISNAIYQAVGGEDRHFVTLDLLHAELKKILSQKRFFVVLDDVWNEDPKKWDLLRSAFDVGAHGSKFLVTTRKNKVASMMDCFQPYIPEALSDEISLSLLAQSALDEQNFNKYPSLKSIAQGIVKKCDGLPLALVTLGKVLKRKGSDEEWEELLNSEIWNLDDESGILPALKLSYYDLPSHLKLVFAYCSLFPKDYEFEKQKLVLLWMAQGFLSQTKGKNQPMESLGGKYFQELLSRSFFQPLGNDESRYIMHDLINDLATSVAGEFFFRLDENTELNNRNEAYEKFRHCSFIGQQRVVEYKKFKELHRARCLRTFLPVSVGWRDFNTLDDVTAELLPRLKFLRVLSLTNESITQVPHSIGNLKHLRYLNFSETIIERIPEQVSELYNLQSLLVHDCMELSSLPMSFAKLINLRHLDMTNTPSLKKLPLGIGGCRRCKATKPFHGNAFLSLESLEVDDMQCLKIWSTSGGDDVQTPRSFPSLREISMKRCPKLSKVSFGLIPSVENLTVIRCAEAVLRDLVGVSSSIRTLELDAIEGLTQLDREVLKHLGSLQELYVFDCPKLESIKGLTQVTGSLRQVRLWCCDALESYCCPNSVESLEIVICDSITSLSFSKLQEEDLPSSSSSSSSSNLKYLEIRNCKNIKSISQEHLQSLTSLEEMWIYECPSMEDSFPSCGLWPPNLKRLRTGELKKPLSEWGLQSYPSSLVKLHLYGRDSGVVSFGMEEQHHNNTMSSTCFLLPPSLTSLELCYFEEVESVSEVLQHLPHLQHLEIYDVPETTSSLKVDVY